MTPERSLQEYYPLGVFSARRVALVALSFALVYAIAMTWSNRDDIVLVPVAVLAIALVVVCGTLVERATRISQPTLSRRRALAAVVLADLAMLLSTVSVYGHDTRIRDDWGPLIVALVILVLGAYRPAAELGLYGAFSALLAGLLSILAIPSSTAHVPAVLFVIVGMVPIVVVTLVATVFVARFVESVVRWRERARAAASSLGDFDAAWIARSVQQDSVTVLNQDVVPFLARIAQQGVIDDHDAEAARAISSSIRAVLVAEVDRSWLTALVERAAPEAIVRDPKRLADRMTLDERACLRAAFAALVRHPGFTGRGLVVSLEQSGEHVRANVSAQLEGRSGDVRERLAPYRAVLRVVFPDVEVGYSNGLLALGFSYGGQRS